MLTRINNKSAKQAQRDSSLSLSRKIASAVSAIALSILVSTTFTLQAQTPQGTDEKIKQLEKELRLLELQKQIDQAKKEQSSNNPTDKATDDSSATSTTQSTQSAQTTQATQPKQIIQYRAPKKPKHYDYGYDRSGSFVGVELGYGEISTSSLIYGIEEKDGGFKYGLLLGYNKFFVKYFGIRFYGNANVTQISDKTSGDWLYRLNYGVNLDGIANFFATDYADLGAFVGIGVGGQTYFFTGQNKEQLDAFESMGGKVSYTSVDVGLNVGLRTNIAKHFGIELAARVPFIKHNLFESKGVYVLKETYSISARLLWNY